MRDELDVSEDWRAHGLPAPSDEPQGGCMTLITLSPQDRDRFAAWCEQEAESDRGILEQMAKIETPVALKTKLQAERSAALIIAQKLRATITESW